MFLLIQFTFIAHSERFFFLKYLTQIAFSQKLQQNKKTRLTVKMVSNNERLLSQPIKYFLETNYKNRKLSFIKYNLSSKLHIQYNTIQFTEINYTQ